MLPLMHEMGLRGLMRCDCAVGDATIAALTYVWLLTVP
jgi:hypothetical protein